MWQLNLRHFCKEKKQKETKKNPEVKLTALISLTCKNNCACTEITIEASLFKFKLNRMGSQLRWIVSTDGEESLMLK
jgi:hypothetical protein